MGGVSGDAAERFVVADDQDLTAILDRAEAAAANLVAKAVHADISFDIASLAPNDLALLDRLAHEEIAQPVFRADG